jgi:hypothetical protein
MELSNHEMGSYLYLTSGIADMNLIGGSDIYGVDPGLRNMVSYIDRDI